MQVSDNDPNATVPFDIAFFGARQGARIAENWSAGHTTMQFRKGALRRIEASGVEILRAVAFIVRDRYWRTIEPRLDTWRTQRTPDGIEASWTLRFVGAECDVSTDLRLVAASEKFLLSARASVLRETWTNRAGLVLLHPATACAGRPLTITHPNGTTETGQFPSLIAAHMPFTDVAALEVDVDHATRLAARFAGDVFEMEDQRNWSDASFKTYSRPLARPWPYRLKQGDVVEQSVEITIEQRGASRRPSSSASAAVSARIQFAGTIGSMPSLGLGVHAERAACDEKELDLLRRLRPALLCLAASQSTPDHAIVAFAHLVRDAKATGALEIALGPGMPDAIAALKWIASQSAAADLRPGALSVHPTTAETIAAAREAFPSARIGGGTRLFFAQINRGQFPSNLDFLSWTISPCLHDTEDDAVMETLESLPGMIALAHRRFPSVPLWVGPNTLKPRFRPLTEGLAIPPLAPDELPDDVDLRQRGLFAGAWTLGFVSRLAYAGVETVTMFEPFGDRGVIASPRLGAPAVPSGMAVHPAYHVLLALALGRGAPLVRVEVDRPDEVCGIAWGGSRPRALFANLTPKPLLLRLEGCPVGGAFWRLDGQSFVQAGSSPHDFEDSVEQLGAAAIPLPSYAVLSLRPNV